MTIVGLSLKGSLFLSMMFSKMKFQWGIVMIEGTRLLKQSPKGNQDKWVSVSEVFKVDHFSGEGLSEYLVSLFLESSNSPVPFIPYRLLDKNLCSSLSFKPQYDFISFAKLLDIYLREQSWRSRIVANAGSVFNYWMKNYWNRFTAYNRVEFVADLFESYGVSRLDTYNYLTCMVELDTLVLNTDRHFNNFGIMYDNYHKRYIPSLIFDNGISLGTSMAELDGHVSLYGAIDLRRVRVKPFGTRVSVNRGSLPPFRFDFNIVDFCNLLESTCEDVSFVKSSLQFSVLKRRLIEVYANRDCNNLGIAEYFLSRGL